MNTSTIILLTSLGTLAALTASYALNQTSPSQSRTALLTALTTTALALLSPLALLTATTTAALTLAGVL